MSLPVSDRGVMRVPPLPAILAAPLAVISAFAPGVFFLVVLGFSGGQMAGREWLLLLPSLAVSLGLLVGAVLLLLGRSWLVVAVSGAALGALLVGGTVFDGWGEDALDFWLSAGLLPVLTAVLASSRPVRAWVEARRATG